MIRVNEDGNIFKTLKIKDWFLTYCKENNGAVVLSPEEYNSLVPPCRDESRYYSQLAKRGMNSRANKR